MVASDITGFGIRYGIWNARFEESFGVVLKIGNFMFFESLNANLMFPNIFFTRTRPGLHFLVIYRKL